MSDTIEKVREWIQSKHMAPVELSDDLDLIESRIIDSLHFTELIFLLESLSKRRIDIESLNVEQLRTLSAIEQNFLREVTP